MGKLWVVRHAQASFFSDNYDQLTELGRAQAALLGESWKKRGFSPHKVYLGPCVRHAETAQIVSKVYEKAHLPWPKSTVLHGLDEFHFGRIMKEALPSFLEKDPTLKASFDVYLQSDQRTERLRNFQKVQEVIMDAWARGEVESPEIESWRAFSKRVNESVAGILADAERSEGIVIFTSGGPLAVTLQRALDLTPSKTLQMAWMTGNASVTEFWYSKDRFTLSYFNALSHLETAEQLTYR